MIPRLAGGWQTTMADLALILFIVSVAGLQAGDETKETQESQKESLVSAQGEPLAIYSAREGAPPVGTWLAEQAPDHRQHLTIVARYRPGDVGTAARKALALAGEAGEAGRSARIVLEQGAGEDVLALLAYDRPPEEVARSLQGKAQD